MARNLTTGFKTAAEAELCQPVILAEIDTLSAAERRPILATYTPGAHDTCINPNASIDGDLDTYAEYDLTHLSLSDSGYLSISLFPGLPAVLDDGDVTVRVTLATGDAGLATSRFIKLSSSANTNVGNSLTGYDEHTSYSKQEMSFTYAAGTCPSALFLNVIITSDFLGENFNWIRIYEVTIQKANGNVYVWNGLGNKVWNGHTWIGMGKFGSLTPISESTDMTATGCKLSLSGIPSDLVTLVLGELSQTLPAIIWFGFLDDTGAVIANPYLAFGGLVDVPDIEDAGATSIINIAIESPFIIHHKPQGQRYTDADQQALFPGDRGFEFVDKIQETNISLGITGRMPITTQPSDQ